MGKNNVDVCLGRHFLHQIGHRDVTALKYLVGHFLPAAILGLQRSHADDADVKAAHLFNDVGLHTVNQFPGIFHSNIGAECGTVGQFDQILNLLISRLCISSFGGHTEIIVSRNPGIIPHFIENRHLRNSLLILKRTSQENISAVEYQQVIRLLPGFVNQGFKLRQPLHPAMYVIVVNNGQFVGISLLGLRFFCQRAHIR